VLKELKKNQNAFEKVTDNSTVVVFLT